MKKYEIMVTAPYLQEEIFPGLRIRLGCQPENKIQCERGCWDAGLAFTNTEELLMLKRIQGHNCNNFE
jgi:hypothetical protein